MNLLSQNVSEKNKIKKPIADIFKSDRLYCFCILYGSALVPSCDKLFFNYTSKQKHITCKHHKQNVKHSEAYCINQRGWHISDCKAHILNDLSDEPYRAS